MTGFNVIARTMILEREQGLCLRCGTTCVWWPDDHRPVAVCPYSIHHRRPRGMGGSVDPLTNHPSNGILLCGTGTTGCHGWVESHRTQALTDGYLIPSSWDPRTTPVRLPSGARVLLELDRYRYLEEPPA